MKLSVVIPCYNESKNIPLVLQRFSKAIKSEDIEVIVVNNGSSDDTQEVLVRLLPQYQFARSIKVEVNQGYGYGILCGLRSGTGEYLAWTHADMQTDPQDVIRALNLVEQSARPQESFVKGNRKGRTLVDNFFTWGMNVFESIYLGALLNDINAQPNLFHSSFFNKWLDPPFDFSLDLYALYLAKKNGLKIMRFPVLFPKRIYGRSNWNTDLGSKWKFIKRTLDFSFRLKKAVG